MGGNVNPECKQQPPGNGMRGGREKEGRVRPRGLRCAQAVPLVLRLFALHVVSF